MACVADPGRGTARGAHEVLGFPDGFPSTHCKLLAEIPHLHHVDLHRRERELACFPLVLLVVLVANLISYSAASLCQLASSARGLQVKLADDRLFISQEKFYSNAEDALKASVKPKWKVGTSAIRVRVCVCARQLQKTIIIILHNIIEY